MHDKLSDVAAGLADVLARENDALKRLDFAAAVALVPAKERALEELTRGPASSGTSAVEQQRLRELAAENQELLEQAIAVQTRVVRIVTRAVVMPPPAIGYSDQGNAPRPARGGAMAVSTRA